MSKPIRLWESHRTEGATHVIDFNFGNLFEATLSFRLVRVGDSYIVRAAFEGSEGEVDLGYCELTKKMGDGATLSEVLGRASDIAFFNQPLTEVEEVAEE